MTSDQLITTTAWLFNVDKGLLMGDCRVARVAEARQALAWALRQAGWSLESIGDFLHRDHTTIIYAVKVIDRRRQHDQRLAERLTALVVDSGAPIDWKARVVQLEARVGELEALLLQKKAA